MDPQKTAQWQALVNAFDFHKDGLSPWDADRAEKSWHGASHGEKCALAFLLNVWDSGHEWQCGPFDVLDAYSVWDDVRRNAFLRWAAEPWWP